jgi:hypothetical protein
MSLVVREQSILRMGPALGDAVEWLLVAYQLSPKQSSVRVAVRRKLSAAGAVYLSPACAVAPRSGQAERAMRRARAAITSAGGFAVLLAGQALAGERDLIEAFNAVRDSEYEDIIVSCRDAVTCIDALTATSELRYQGLWENDIRLSRLSGRYKVVRGQDVHGARRGQAAVAALAAYRSALDEYAARVYAADSR